MKRLYAGGTVVSVCIVVCVWLAGCSSVRTYPESMIRSPFVEEWKPVEAGAAANVAKPAVAPVVAPQPESAPVVAPQPESVPAAENTSKDSNTGTSRALPRQMIEDLNLPADTSVAVVLRALAKVGNINIVISPKVDGIVTFTFKNISWDQAFIGVINTAGLTYIWDGEIIRVMTLDDMKRELEIDKIRNERETLRDALTKVEPLTLHVIKVKYISAKKIAKTIKEMLGTVPVASTTAIPIVGRVMVSLDEENSSLIVKATQKDADKIAALVLELDQPRMQVRIDARIVEANSSTARQLGVQWGGSYLAIDGNNNNIFTTGSGNRDWAANFPATFDSSDVGFTLGVLQQNFGGSELLNLQLSALQEDGKAKILSSPSITTLDNETAAIESGQERAYRVTSNTGNNLDTSLAWKKAVLKLEVTPHVIDQQTLRVEIVANKDSFDESRTESNGEFPVNTKNTKTTVLLKNGQTTVIGGLSEKVSSESESGIPILKSIPLLGRMFKGTKEGASLDEVLIFITPTILKEPATTTLREGM